MRYFVALIVCICSVFCGCNQSKSSLDNAVSLRNQILNSNGYTFSTTINADYGDEIYSFSMDCTSDKEGNLAFTVTKPDSISGITGKISTSGGAITFDDKVLAFQTLADGEITPVAAPWIFVKTIQGGYIRGASAENGSYKIEIDDSYEENALRLNIFVEDNLPIGGEIFWKGRRAIAFTVENFILL